VVRRKARLTTEAND